MVRGVYQAKTYALAALATNEAADPALRGFRSISKHWLARAADGFVPRRSDLTFRDFAGWHARMIVSALPENGDLLFRIVGGDIDEMFGLPVRRGTHFSDLPFVTFEDYADYFRAIWAGGVYGRYSGMVPFRGREHRSFDVLDLPVADESGAVAFLYSFFQPNFVGP